MLLEKNDIDNVRIITLCERIDVANIMYIEDEINELITETFNKIVIDFKRIQYFNSTGIRVLFHINKRLKIIGGGRIIMTNMNRSVIKVLTVVNLLGIYESVDTLEEAVNLLRSTP